jgi:iron uptake system EfeUOB component EfeO/EfeM
MLNEVGTVEEFMDAVDADDFGRARALMKKAKIDSETIEMVLRKMADSQGEH